MEPLVSSVNNEFQLSNLERRKPKGIGVSPYPFMSLIRYIFNSLSNGWFSYMNPDRDKMRLLGKEGRITRGGTPGAETSTLKIVFLGDIMVSRSGKPPQLDDNLKDRLKEADVVIANVESPVVGSSKTTRRGCSLNFEMNNSYLAEIYACNPKAKWVFSIANNHVCDTSRKSNEDVSGVETTIENIKAAIPAAEVIGAEIGTAKSVLSLQVNEGPKIGVVGWTGVMNHDRQHYKKKIIRGTDLTIKAVNRIKKEHHFLIGFGHDNEEQSYYPLKETRDRWCQLIGKKKFDVIVGHGPHVLQPGERVGKRGILFNSIGNFCSPVGKSQTKVGCMPEITLHYQKDRIISTQYKVHILQQQGEKVSLLQDLNAENQLYPAIIKRLKKIWKDLFN